MQFPEKHVARPRLRLAKRDSRSPPTNADNFRDTLRREGTREGDIYALVALDVSGHLGRTYRSLFRADTVTPDAISDENDARAQK